MNVISPMVPVDPSARPGDGVRRVPSTSRGCPLRGRAARGAA
jgi:hypothetical protein